jgi:hypothetical protein
MMLLEYVVAPQQNYVFVTTVKLPRKAPDGHKKTLSPVNELFFTRLM